MEIHWKEGHCDLHSILRVLQETELFGIHWKYGWYYDLKSSFPLV